MFGAIQPVDDHRTLGDTVFDQLRDAVIDGRLAPGQWLRQEALARELGVSQMPVREALKRLVAEGLAERIPYRGVRVVEFTPEDIVDMMTVRLVLEGLAVRHAARLISDEDLAQLERNLEEAVHYTDQAQMARRRELNTQFHLTLCRASGRRYLVHQIEAFWGRFPSTLLYEGMRRQEELSPARLARENQEHWAILRAIEQRDAKQAEAAMRRHIRNLAQELTEVLGIPPQSVKPLLSL